MPITDAMKKQLAQKHRLFFKICRTCGSRNSPNAYRCRRCRGDNLRWKKREFGAKEIGITELKLSPFIGLESQRSDAAIASAIPTALRRLEHLLLGASASSHLLSPLSRL